MLNTSSPRELLESLRLHGHISDRAYASVSRSMDRFGVENTIIPVEDWGKFVARYARIERAFDTLIRAIEHEGYSVLVDPDGNYSVEVKGTEDSHKDHDQDFRHEA